MPATGISGKMFTFTERGMPNVAGSPPLRAQKREGLESAFAVRNSPLAVRMSKESAWSAAALYKYYLAEKE
jgi:hypothetical protein